MRRRSMALLVTAGLTAAIGAGCSSSDTSAPTTTSTSTTTTTSTPRTMAVDTPDGQVSLSLDGELPPNWPSGFPVPSGATPAGSGSLGGSDKTVMVGVYTTTEAPDETFTFYRSSAELSVESPSSAGAGNAFVGKLTLTGTYEGSVSVVGAAGSTLIVVVLQSPGAGSNGTVVPPTDGPSGSTPGTSVAADPT